MAKPRRPKKQAATARAVLRHEIKTFLLRLTREIEKALPLQLPVLSWPLELAFQTGGMVTTIRTWRKAKRPAK
jgi:hypothetical protein